MKYSIILIFIPVFLFSQNPANLFPHHVGDVWQYIDEIGNYWTRTVVKDSLDSDSSHHIFFTHKPDYYVRSNHYIADSLNEIWGYDYDDSLWLFYKLAADSGEIYLYGSGEDRNIYAIVKDVGVDYFFGRDRFYKEFVFFESNHPENYPEDALESTNAILVDSIGWVYSWYEPDGFSALTGCIINDKQYGAIVGIKKMSSTKPPTIFSLYPNYPNPFNGITKIKYQLYLSSFIEISIYNIKGQQIAVLVSEKKQPGIYSYNWNAEGNNSGLYFIEMKSSGAKIIKKCVLLK